MSAFDHSVERAKFNGFELTKKTKNVNYSPAYKLSNGDTDFHIGNLHTIEKYMDQIEETAQDKLAMKYAATLESGASEFLNLYLNKDMAGIEKKFPGYFNPNVAKKIKP